MCGYDFIREGVLLWGYVVRYVVWKGEVLVMICVFIKGVNFWKKLDKL